jgi:hypothetical protein
MFHGFRWFDRLRRRRALLHGVAGSVAAAVPQVFLLEKLSSRDQGVWLRDEVDKLTAAGAAVFRSQGGKLALTKLPDAQFLYRVLRHTDFTQVTVDARGEEMKALAWA